MRRRILELLRDGPVPVGKLADQLPVGGPGVSKHLRVLVQAGVDKAFEIFTARIGGWWPVTTHSVHGEATRPPLRRVRPRLARGARRLPAGDTRFARGNFDGGAG